MRVIMMMFDSVNRHMLGPYSSDPLVKAPNFVRLAQRTATFERSYVCSMPCMPARRDLHTGRPSFLHCGWGPLEPFDDSVPQMLSQQGIYTHLASDHYHYWEDGGSTYHGRYDSWEFFRGQEGDPFVGQVKDPVVPQNINGKGRRSDWVNRMHIKTEAQFPQTQTFAAGLKFLDMNHDQDRWFLQIECFDPHEPFVVPDRYQDMYPSDYDGPLFDWPGYRQVTESPNQVAEARRRYAALLTQCDTNLGRLLDAMDRHDMWKDTMLIVWTDHGFMLGEHGCWAKNWMPLYEEVSHTPFFVWDPRCPPSAGRRRAALVQPAIDLGPTLLDFFGMTPTRDMLGKSLAGAIAHDDDVRAAALFGYHGSRINVTDGRYKYLRDPLSQGCPAYTLSTNMMRGFKRAEQLAGATLAEPFAFTKNMPTLKIGGGHGEPRQEVQHLLFDLKADPHEQHPLDDPVIEKRMIDHMVRLMDEADAPPEQYQRMGLIH
ncbi:MAG: sulfatase [Phycisphaeraceae bacterium]